MSVPPTHPGEPSSASASGNDRSAPPEPQTPPRYQSRHTRQCRICLEEVEPTFEEPGMLGGLRNRRPKRHYVSEDLGRLLCPCQCSGSQKYVHEGCIKEWINQSPRGYECPTCRYTWKMERLTWAQRLRSPVLALAITISVLLVTIFLLGFIADPLLGLYLDPLGTISDSVASRSGLRYEDPDPFEEEDGWVEHFLKGVFSLGLLGFVKAFLAMTPWQWWNIRASGIVGGGTGRRGGTGRDRLANVNLTLVLIGVATFLYTVWKATRSYIEKTLDRASQKILNVQNDDDDDDDDYSNNEAEAEPGDHNRGG
ncbi:hypothetical protein GGR56DRAFT_665061 [Xylariaceae sp. FL0804]|nr:hypothetical protein GGR56DRAFT_665061 [Xylariaceae sp. FL0804]